MTSEMVHLGAQRVVALGIGRGRLVQCGRCLDRRGRRCVAQTREHVQHMLATRQARLEFQFDRDEHGFQTELRHGDQRLRLDLVAADAAQQRMLQAFECVWQIGKGRAIAQRAGLAFDQLYVVEPVVDRVCLTLPQPFLRFSAARTRGQPRQTSISWAVLGERQHE